MARVPDIIPVSDFRQGAAAILRKIHDSNEPVVLTQRGRAAAILLSVEEYERREHEFDILRLLAQGEREIAAGKGFTLSEVLAEADDLLEGPSR